MAFQPDYNPANILPEQRGKCGSGCPLTCPWRSGLECRRYRGSTNLKKGKTVRWVNPASCWVLKMAKIGLVVAPSNYEDALGTTIGSL